MHAPRSPPKPKMLSLGREATDLEPYGHLAGAPVIPPALAIQFVKLNSSVTVIPHEDLSHTPPSNTAKTTQIVIGAIQNKEAAIN